MGEADQIQVSWTEIDDWRGIGADRRLHWLIERNGIDELRRVSTLSGVSCVGTARS
jgi:hypothetical protein